MNDLERFKQTYITECYELLSDMEARLLDLDPETADKETLNAIFRCAHSIKGGSGAFGLDYIMDFTHVLEALLDAMREDKIKPTREAVDLLLQSVDIVSKMVTAAKENTTPPEGFGGGVMKQLKRFVEAGVPAETTKQTAYGLFGDDHAPDTQRLYRIHFEPKPSLFASGNEPLLILRELSRLGKTIIHCHTDKVPPLDTLDPTQCYLHWDIELTASCEEKAIREVFEFVEDHCVLQVEATVQSVAKTASDATGTQTPHPTANDNAKAAGSSSTKPAQGSSIRVDLEKVDRLVNMVGELVITEAMLRAQTRDFPVEQFAGLIRGIDELSQHTRELQEAVMSVRMQPVKSIFSRMPRIVRDLSTQLGKEIRLEMSGESTEVDKTVIEQLSDPLTHMIRNSVDHGIETPDIRLKNGKDPEGIIHLSAYHRGGRIIIEVSDDGAGISRERVLAKAREKHLVSPESSLSDEEVDNLIFVAGFSTAETVTNVSGRGVGMDVVKRNIEGMGGTVHLINRPGKGSSFSVSLPLTLAILDGMIVRVGSETYIVPIAHIIETLRPASGDVRKVEGHSDVINVRGEFIPVVYLFEMFGIHNAQHDPSKALIVLVESGKEKLGLVVDELIGQQQVVIKSLEANADPVKGISGATILGDGRVSLILEINDLARLSRDHASRPSETALAA